MGGDGPCLLPAPVLYQVSTKSHGSLIPLESGDWKVFIKYVTKPYLQIVYIVTLLNCWRTLADLDFEINEYYCKNRKS